MGMPLEPTSRAQPSQPLRVLVIDDDEMVRRVLCSYLAQRGHAATAVGTQSAAFLALSAAEFDVVVADVLLPDGDGIDIMKHVVVEELPARLVAITGGGRFFGPEFFQRIAEALGAVALQKPFAREEFLAAIEGRPQPQPETLRTESE